MAENEPDSYAAAVEQAQELLRAGRLADPAEHFPYKYDVVCALVAENPPAGPDEGRDDGVFVEDYMTREIADASKAYIEAQESYLRDPGDGTYAAYSSARDVLVAARRSHRENRPAPVVVGVRARRAGE